MGLFSDTKYSLNKLRAIKDPEGNALPNETFGEEAASQAEEIFVNRQSGENSSSVLMSDLVDGEFIANGDGVEGWYQEADFLTSTDRSGSDFLSIQEPEDPKFGALITLQGMPPCPNGPGLVSDSVEHLPGVVGESMNTLKSQDSAALVTKAVNPRI